MNSIPLVLLAGGVSSRMKKPLEAPIDISPELIEEANTLPKCMLSVGPNGERFVQYILAHAIEAGFEDVILVLGEKDTVSESIVRAVCEEKNFHIRLHVARQRIPEGRTKPWGTGDAVLQALEQYPELTRGRFVLSNSDNLLPISVYKAAFESTQNTLICFSTESFGIPSEKRVAYGLVAIDPVSQTVEAIVEKPSIGELALLDSKYVLSLNMNCASLDGVSSLAFLRALRPNPIRDEKEITDLFAHFVGKKDLLGIVSEEPVPDLTSKEDIPRVRDFLAGLAV